MTVSVPGVIDRLGIEKRTRHVVLTVVDDLDWSDEGGHLRLLESKLNAYLAFIESGEVFERLSTDVGRSVPTSTPIKVSILAQFELPVLGRAFLEHACGVFRSAGFELAFKVVTAPS